MPVGGEVLDGHRRTDAPPMPPHPYPSPPADMAGPGFPLSGGGTVRRHGGGQAGRGERGQAGCLPTTGETCPRNRRGTGRADQSRPEPTRLGCSGEPKTESCLAAARVSSRALTPLRSYHATGNARHQSAAGRRPPQDQPPTSGYIRLPEFLYMLSPPASCTGWRLTCRKHAPERQSHDISIAQRRPSSKPDPRCIPRRMR